MSLFSFLFRLGKDSGNITALFDCMLCRRKKFDAMEELQVMLASGVSLNDVDENTKFFQTVQEDNCETVIGKLLYLVEQMASSRSNVQLQGPALVEIYNSASMIEELMDNSKALPERAHLYIGKAFGTLFP